MEYENDRNMVCGTAGGIPGSRNGGGTVEIRDNSGNIVGRADLDGYYSSDELNRKLDEARKDMQRLLEEQRRKAADETARQVRQAIENERANQARMRLEIEREIERLKNQLQSDRNNHVLL